MFDKNKFAQILKNINETYISQRDFSKKSEINRTYLSQYMNMKLDEPPKPKILEKLADASNNIVSYDELMQICGYVSSNYYKQIYELEDNLKILEESYLDKLSAVKLSKEEENVFEDLTTIIHFSDFKNISTIEFDNKINSYFDNMDYLNEKSIAKISQKLKIFIQYGIEMKNSLDTIGHLRYNTTSSNVSNNIKNNYLFSIPVLGKIAAGQPILAEEYLEGYLPVDPNIYGMTTPDDYFYLKVSGESMNLKVHNGDYALIHKQDYADDGDIIVASVNGNDEATLKKYKRINENTIALEPMSTLPMETIYIDLKDKNFKIIGKAIGQFGKF